MTHAEINSRNGGGGGGYTSPRVAEDNAALIEEIIRKAHAVVHFSGARHYEAVRTYLKLVRAALAELRGYPK
jgi:hypothetical protein